MTFFVKIFASLPALEIDRLYSGPLKGFSKVKTETVDGSVNET